MKAKIEKQVTIGTKTKTVMIEREVIGQGAALGDVTELRVSTEIEGRPTAIIYFTAEEFEEIFPGALDVCCEDREWIEELRNVREKLRQGNAYRISA